MSELSKSLLLMAEHQITGFTHASQGYSFEDLIDSMGLTQKEFNHLRQNIPEIFTEIMIVDAVFYYDEQRKKRILKKIIDEQNNG